MTKAYGMQRGGGAGALEAASGPGMGNVQEGLTVSTNEWPASAGSQQEWSDWNGG